MQKLFIVGVIFFSLFSCKEGQIKDKITGVWIFESKINNLYLKNSSDLMTNAYPIIYDFKENGCLVVKDYGNKDTTLKWFIKPDSLLTIGRLDYTIHSINQDRLILIDYNAVDTFWLTYKRPNCLKVNYDVDEIKNILLSNIWSIEDSINQKWATHFEYFDNQTMISRYKIFDLNLNDSTDNLQIETWGIAQYNDYLFLYSYIDMFLGNGHINKINQIIDISPSAYTISDNSRLGYTKYIKKNVNVLNADKYKLLNGNWVSKNSKDKIYGKYIPKRLIETGLVALYEGDLLLKISQDELSFKINVFEPVNYDWQLSKDGKILILEYNIDEPERKGIHVTCADILELTNNKLKIRLFDNNYYTGIEKPNSYLLNLIQEFER